MPKGELKLLLLLLFNTTLTQDVLCAGGQDDDLCPGGCVSNLHPRVAILGQLVG